MVDAAITPPELPVPQINSKQAISGFWRRLSALIVDFIILTGAGAILGAIFRNTFTQMGDYGRLVGYGIALLYFGILNSSIGHGKTVGKRLMKIEVVDREGNHITPCRSFLRFAILGAPFFLNGPIPDINIITGILVFLIAGGLGFAIIYLAIFNNRTRQSMHDIILSTYVIKSPRSREITREKVWQWHYIIIALIIGIHLVMGIILSSYYKKLDLPLQPFREKLMASGQYHKVRTSFDNWNNTRGSKTEKELFISLFPKSENADPSKTADRTAETLFADFPQLANGLDRIVIATFYGYDIGIYKNWRSNYISHSTDEWKKILPPDHPKQK